MKAKPASRASLDDLLADVRLAMEHRRFKDAIVIFKDLLRLERRAEWEQGLAEAYRQRAGQVADKGMTQEAVILWENHAALNPAARPSDAYLGWLAQAGQFPKLAKLLAAADADFGQGPVACRLPETLAVLALQNEKLLAPFPAEHPVAKHHPVIKRALRAYAAGRDDEAEEALKQIPSRSPYRNVRTLLKALLLLGRDRAAGLALAQRVEADSACMPLARLLRQHAAAEGPDAAAAFELPPKQQALIQKINGYSKAQLNLAKEAKKIAKGGGERQLLNAALNSRELLGEAACRRFCEGLLVYFPEGMDAFQKAFGKLSPFERHRLFALNAEVEHDYQTAVEFWEQAIGELGKLPESDPAKQDRALIFRHIAGMAEAEEPEIAIDALENSLKLDPGDRASYVALIRLNESLDEPKEAQEWLDRALYRFPKDVELLGLAMHAASRRKAFKKAAALAKALLEIDPINSPARHFLLAAHLGHARKQFRAGRLDLAQQELEQARAWDARRRNASLCILEGFLALKKADQAQAAGLLAEGWRLAGGGLCAQFLLNIEGLGLAQSAAWAKAWVPGLDKNHVAERAELSALAKLIGQNYGEEKKLLSEALKPLQPVLKRSFKQPALAEDDYFALCQCFAAAAQFDLLGDCAKEAARRFPLAAGPVYFEVYAACKGSARRLSGRDEQRLGHALDRARRAKDSRAGVLIEKFFRALEEYEEEGFDADFLPGLEGLQAKLTPDLERRIMEVDDLPREKLLAMLAQAMPGAPLHNMPRAALLDMARMLLMNELGIDLKAIFGGALPLDLPPPPKRR